MWTLEPETLLGRLSSSYGFSYTRAWMPGQQSVGSERDHRAAGYSVNCLFLGIMSGMKVTGHVQVMLASPGERINVLFVRGGVFPH